MIVQLRYKMVNAPLFVAVSHVRVAKKSGAYTEYAIHIQETSLSMIKIHHRTLISALESKLSRTTGSAQFHPQPPTISVRTFGLAAFHRDPFLTSEPDLCRIPPESSPSIKR